MIKLLLINGPNLNMLGLREPEIYGSTTLEDIEKNTKITAEKNNCQLMCFQSNHEGEIIDTIQSAKKTFDGIIINAGAYSHTSIAIHDALACIKIKKVEVHISNIYKREDFRHKSYLSDVCDGCIIGLGPIGYEFAVKYLADVLSKEKYMKL